MRMILMFCISLRLCSWIEGQFCNSQENCRQLEFRPDHTFNGKRLKNHMIRSHDVLSGDLCEMNCYMEANCVSYNLKRVADQHGRYKCELSNSTFEGRGNKLETNSEYTYRGGKNACLKKPCKNGATCQTGFTSKGYQCLCKAGFRGSHCKKDIDECAKGNHNCDVNALCNNTKGSYNCTCNPGYYGDGRNCKQYKVSSCKEIYDKKISTESKAHPLIVENEVIDVYCHMTMNSTGNGACGDGGWTLVVKIDGSKSTFHYDSKFWSNKETFDLSAGQTGFDTFETKLPTYWNTSFSKICLGMKVDGHYNFVVLDKSAASLHSLIADDRYRDTSLDRDTWKKLIGSQASLQHNCNKQGFNARCLDHNHSKARIGILGNDWKTCFLCNSRIGFGTGGIPDNTNSCGNEAENYGDNGDKHIKAMGYIFVQ